MNNIGAILLNSPFFPLHLHLLKSTDGSMEKYRSEGLKCITVQITYVIWKVMEDWELV